MCVGDKSRIRGIRSQVFHISQSIQQGRISEEAFVSNEREPSATGRETDLCCMFSQKEIQYVENTLFIGVIDVKQLKHLYTRMKKITPATTRERTL